jgi:hypothetical protein
MQILGPPAELGRREWLEIACADYTTDGAASLMDREQMASIFEAVKVLQLRPTDFLVMRTSAALSVDQMGLVHAFIEEETGHSRILILDRSSDLEVLRFEGQQAQAAPEPPKAEGPRIAPNGVVIKGEAPGAIS